MKFTKVKTSELIEGALDWAVIEAQGSHSGYWLECYLHPDLNHRAECESPSTNGAYGQVIIDRCKINSSYGHGLKANLWFAERYRSYSLGRDTASQQYGPTALIACMRSFVASEMGEVVEVPDELL